MKNFLFSLLLFVIHITCAQKSITITYTGNMGILIEASDTSILIDGLHEKYGDDYLFPPRTLVNQLITTNKGSYTPPSVLLFSHKHGDHYSSKLANEFIKNNPSGIVIGSKQISEEINDKEKTVLITTNDYSKQDFFYKDVKIRAFKIDHAGARHKAIENVGYIITVGKKNFLHVGDTSWNLEHKMFDTLKMKDEKIDVAFLPYWMLLEKDAKKLIKQYFKNSQIIATHISPRIPKKDLEALKTKYPKVYFLTHLEEQLKF